MEARADAVQEGAPFMGLLLQRVLLDERDDIGGAQEAERGKGIRRAIVECQTARGGVTEAPHREADPGHEPGQLIGGFRVEEGLFRAGDHLPRLFEIEQHGADRVHVPVAGGRDAVIDEEPSLARLNRRGTRTDLRALPPRAAAAHHVAVLAPVDHVRAFADEDVPEGRVAGVGGPAQHEKVLPELPGEEDAVPVVGKEGVLELLKLHEILGLRYADRGPVVAVAPGHVIGAVHERHARVIGIFEPAHFGILAREDNRLRLERELQSVGAPADVEVRDAVHALRAEDAYESALPGDDGAVVDARDAGKRPAADDGIGAIAPCQVGIARRPGFPGNVRQCGTNDL